MPRQIRAALDSQAMAWARILDDPCSAPLAHPCYAGSDGGILIRCESIVDIGTGVTDTSGAFFWSPGGLGLVSTFATGLCQGVAANSTSTMSSVSMASTLQPGYAYLSQNAANFRAVAACMQITYLGSEANRSGVVSFGGANGTTFNTTDSISAGSLSTVLEKFERTPVGTIEVKWRPSAYDQTFKDTTATLSVAELAKYSSVGMVYSGLQAAAGIRIRMVCVYEYQPSNSLGVVSASTARNTSSNSLDHVINYLDSTGDWMYRVAGSAGKLLRGAAAVEPYVRAVAYGGTRVAGLLL